MTSLPRGGPEGMEANVTCTCPPSKSFSARAMPR